MGRVLSAFAAFLTAVAISGSAFAMIAGPEASSVPPAPASATMSLWEAYSRGSIAITQVDLTWTEGGATYTAPIGYRVSNSGSADVSLDEYAVLLSPNPRQGSYGATAQDGLLTKATTSAHTSRDYAYGDFVAQGMLSGPAWWCSEQFQFVQKNVVVTLGGELVPFDMETLVESQIGGPGGTQDQVWAHLREFPTLVVGKTVDGKFWEEIPETAGRALHVEIRATNIAIKDTQDGQPDPDAPDARTWDVIPAGYVLDPSTATPGFTLATLPDGTTRISWPSNLPAADVTNKIPDDNPTGYQSRTFGYTMTTPHIAPGRVSLPRARISVGADFTAEAQSAQPILDVFRVELPPVASAGSAYVGVEGDTILFSAAGSTDPNGDPLTFRWDFTADGTWDTGFSGDPTAPMPFGDDFSGRVRVEVSDGQMTSTAEAPVTITDAAPVLSGLRATATGDLTLRIAGEKWHDVTLTIAQGGFSSSASVTRYPGSPDEQSATLSDVEIDVTSAVSITIVYTPEDDPVNGQPMGANPVWVIFDTPTGSVRLHHTFNVNHPETYVWTLDDIAPQLIGLGIRLSATANDVGSDDLAFSVDWGDGTTAALTVYNDGVGPDPSGSIDVHPIAVTESFTTSYASGGTYTITVRVTDDDGMSATATLVLVLG